MDINDDYDHIDPMLIYSPSNVPGPAFSEDNFLELDNGCQCTTDCGLYCYHQGTSPGSSYECGLFDLSRLGQPVFECNSRCSCEPSRCSNRIVTRGPNQNLKICKTKNKGYGLYCSKPVIKGEYICEYAGELLDEETARKRYEHQTKNKKSNYILVLREFSGSKLTCKTIVDPTVIGNIGRYANHSCDPNIVIVPVRIQTVIPHLALVASRDINEDEELCFDYGDPGGQTKQKNMKVEQFEEIISSSNDMEEESRTKCECGSKNCHSFLPFHKDLLLNS